MVIGGQLLSKALKLVFLLVATYLSLHVKYLGCTIKTKSYWMEQMLLSKLLTVTGGNSEWVSGWPINLNDCSGSTRPLVMPPPIQIGISISHMKLINSQKRVYNHPLFAPKLICLFIHSFICQQVHFLLSPPLSVLPTYITAHSLLNFFLTFFVPFFHPSTILPIFAPLHLQNHSSIQSLFLLFK